MAKIIEEAKKANKNQKKAQILAKTQQNQTLGVGYS